MFWLLRVGCWCSVSVMLRVLTRFPTAIANSAQRLGLVWPGFRDGLGDRTGNPGSAARARATLARPVLLKPRAAQAGQAMLLEDALPAAVLSSVSCQRRSASPRLMRPLRTAVTTAALRRTTQRVVFGGGRSSLIGGTSGGDPSSALLTGSRQDRSGPERPALPHGLPLAGLVALRHIALQREPDRWGREWPGSAASRRLDSG